MFALGGFVTLSVGDALVKTMAGAWPGSAIAALRYLIGAVGLVVYVAMRHGRAGFRVTMPWTQIGRGAGVAVATFCFFMGVMVMPLADATAIIFTSPMWTVVLSAIFLGERPKPAVILSILLASAGVLTILQPNVLAFGWEALFPLVAAIGMSCLIMLNRRAAGTAPAMVMQMQGSVAAVPVLLALAAIGHASGLPGLVIEWPEGSVVLRCAIVAFTATMGHWLIFRATERASATTVAPMTYVQLLIAVGAGILLFDNVPTWPMALGAGLIIAAGLWLWRAQTSARVPPRREEVERPR